MAAVRALNIDGLEFHSCTESVLAYSELFARSSHCFPRPAEHIVIADFIIELPVVAADLSPASEHYGRVLGYCYSAAKYEHWIIADSLSEFAARLQQHREGALYGR